MAIVPTTEKWEDVSFGFKFTNDYRLQVSNLGNLKAFNKFPPGEPVKGSTINGYGIFRRKFYRPKGRKLQANLTAEHAAIVALREKVKNWQLEDPKKYNKQITEGKAKLKGLKDSLRKARKQDIKDRTVHYHSLIHRLVAENFLTPKSPKHTVVGHLDYNKRNNAASNLKWMAREENFRHQQSSPLVIKEKKDRGTKFKDTPRGAKLSVGKVAELKKLLAAGKPIQSLVKKFKITNSQIRRIKHGDNWKHVKAAK